MLRNLDNLQVFTRMCKHQTNVFFTYIIKPELIPVCFYVSDYHSSFHANYKSFLFSLQKNVF